MVIKAPVYMKYNFLPALLNIKVTATYQSSTGAPRITQESASLPLKLVVKAAPPVKSAMFKVTIDTNKPPVNLNDLFPGEPLSYFSESCELLRLSFGIAFSCCRVTGYECRWTRSGSRISVLWWSSSHDVGI